MKLRICGDSIRLRLKIGEVERIAAGESIVETTHLPDFKLTYGLAVSESGGMAATFSGGKLIVTLPKADAEEWARTDAVSLVSEQPLEDAGTLSLLVEKDFTCLEPGHHRDCVDDEDTFPHPGAR
jgi:hypothetical protein